MLLALPILSLLTLNLLHQYPISKHARLTLFIFPIVVLLFSAGVQFIIHLCSTILEKIELATPMVKRTGLTPGPLLLLIVICAFVARLSFAGVEPYIHLTPYEDAEGAIRYLSEQHTSRDLLYVHSTMRGQYKFYSKSFPITGGEVIEGNIGWPCCPRRYVNDTFLSPAEVMPAEFARFNLSGAGRHVRLLFTDRQGHWDTFLGRNEPSEFEMWFSKKGCLRTNIKQFIGVRIDEYVCSTGSF
jgi:hypothetical protein